MIGTTATVPLPPRTQRSRWAALGVLCVAVLMVNLDNTILNVALPTLVVHLHATIGQLQWIVDAYAMVFGGMMLVDGSLADRYVPRRWGSGPGPSGSGSPSARSPVGCCSPASGGDRSSWSTFPSWWPASSGP